jgi:hypothetical protein
MDVVKTEIGQLETAVRTLVRRPQLIRPGYWISQIEGLLARPRLSAQDRQRLCALLDQLATVQGEVSNAST